MVLQGQELDSTELVLEEVTIQSDVFTHQVLEYGGAVTSLGRQGITQAEQVYLQPILNSVPGVYMQSGSLNTNRISIRGIGARTPFGTDKVKAYLNEIPLSTGEGETTVEDIDFGTLQNIEVYRGPTSTVFGAGLGGAIHFQTRRLTGNPSVFAEAMVGSFGLRRYNLQAQVANSTKSLGIFYQDVHSDGYRDNNAYDRYSVTLMGQTQVGDRSNMTLYANYTSLLAYIPSSLGLQEYNENPTAAASSWGDAEGHEDGYRYRVGWSLHSRYSTRMESWVTFFVNGSSAAEIRPVFLGNLSTDQLNAGVRAKIKRSFLPRNQLQVVLGMEGFWESYRYREFVNDQGENGDKTRDFDQQRNYGNVFLATEYYPTESWIVSVGANLNLSGYDLEDQLPVDGSDQSQHRYFGPILSPKLSLTRKMTEKVAVYGLVAHGFSLPSFEQSLYPEGELNGDLRPETGWNYELGVKGEVWEDRLYFELVGYAMRTQDLIVNRTYEQVLVGVNAGSAHHDGVELLLEHRVVDQDRLQVSHRLAYSLMAYRFDDFTSEGEDYSGNRITGVPSYTLDYAVDVRWEGFYGRLNYQRVGSISVLDSGSLYTDAYQLINAKVGYERSLGKIRVNVYTGVNNMTNTFYSSMLQINASSGRYYYPGLPINYYGGVKVGYVF
ncbi:hypothetical protein BFP72_14765 [Reichenbachiella sp. 5M10]|nr:hypothetical protein BFP72_14765 [Reichenbachiella sp. 5M10]